jgi:hypothetical protein
MFRKKESDDPILAALQARLSAVEKEIARVSNVATSEQSDQEREHWDLALQLQRDAREIRAAMHFRLQAVRPTGNSGNRKPMAAKCSSMVFVQ